MKTRNTAIKPLEWNEAKDLENLINKASQEKQALVLDPHQGATQVTPAGLISPNENLNGSVRFNTHYGN